MRGHRKYLWPLVLAALIGLPQSPAQARSRAKPRAAQTVRILVHFVRGTSESKKLATIARIGGHKIKVIRHLNTAVVRIPSAHKKAVLARLDASASVAYAEQDGQVRITQAGPDQFLNSSSWQLANPQFPAAWDKVTCSSQVVVAVLDTGVFAGHPDLGPVAQGYNFVSDNTNTADDNGHGTGVDGIVAGLGNNSIGIAGACWGATILPVKVLAAS